ncbi:MAG: hypothetical protein H6816_13640 [Phycisphaerales bacterium]|nr:hypothetical protein [Phycisphaerales bacterium]
MDAELHVRIAGALTLALALLNLTFPRRFGWRQELQRLNLLTRQVFIVHALFIILVLVMIGVLSLVYADTLLAPSMLARLVLIGLAVFWMVRLIVQLFVYDRRLWLGDRFNTTMHVMFTCLWSYLLFTYVNAAVAVS